MKNPFLVIGLSPEVLKGLNDKEIQELVGTVYRALQKMYHPDGLRPNAKKNRELTEAREKLDYEKNRDEYLSFKEAFLKPGFHKRRIEELEKELKFAQEKLEQCSARVSEHVTRELYEIAGKGNLPLDVISMREVALDIGDVVRSLNSGSVNTFRRAPKNQLLVDAQGNLSRSFGQEIVSVPATKLIGCIGENEQALFRDILRDIAKERSDRLGIGGDVYEPAYRQAKARIQRQYSIEDFIRFSFLMTPFLTRRAYIFSITILEEEAPIINFEGQTLSELSKIATAAQ